MTAVEPMATTAPVFRSVDALSGEVTRPSKFFAANDAANDHLAELEALRAENADLKGKTPESKVLAHQTARLLERYLHDAADGDQRAALLNLANLLRHSTAMCAAFGSEVHHYESEALDEWTRADGLQQKLDATEADLADAAARIRELEGQLAAVGGVR